MTRTATATLLRQLQTGGELDASEWDKVIVVDTAAEANVLLLVADCYRARSRSAVLRAIARAVDAPEFFGNDFDALYDCLCDAVIDQKQGLVLWLFKLHSGDPALAEDARRIASICADVVTFARENNRSFTYVVEHAGKHPDPEPGVAAAPYGEG